MALHHEDRAFALADLEEEFEQKSEQLGLPRARRWYQDQVLRSLLPALNGRFVRRSAFDHSTTIVGGSWMKGATGLKNLAGDLKIAGRSLRKTPGVVLITAISLGVGIGAVTAVFGIANSFLFRGSVGISNPEGLVVIHTTDDDGRAFGSSSLADYEDVRKIGAIRDAGAVRIRAMAFGEGERVKPLLAEEVTGNYFSVMGTRAVLGRGFLPEEGEASGGERVVVVSHALWQREFAGRTDIVGVAVRLDGQMHTIVGVAPAGVLSHRVPLEPDIWVPLASVGDAAPSRQSRTERSFLILGRLAEDATRETVDSRNQGRRRPGLRGTPPEKPPCQSPVRGFGGPPGGRSALRPRYDQRCRRQPRAEPRPHCGGHEEA